MTIALVSISVATHIGLAAVFVFAAMDPETDASIVELGEDSPAFAVGAITLFAPVFALALALIALDVFVLGLLRTCLSRFVTAATVRASRG